MEVNAPTEVLNACSRDAELIVLIHGKSSGSAGGLVKFDSSGSMRPVDGEWTLASRNTLSSRRGGEGRGEEARSKNQIKNPAHRLSPHSYLAGRERRGLKPCLLTPEGRCGFEPLHLHQASGFAGGR
jgi:hypothetical protein